MFVPTCTLLCCKCTQFILALVKIPQDISSQRCVLRGGRFLVQEARICSGNRAIEKASARTAVRFHVPLDPEAFQCMQTNQKYSRMQDYNVQHPMQAVLL